MSAGGSIFFLIGKLTPALRVPVRESKKFLSPRTRPSSPDEWTSFEFSAHHGATTCFSTFQVRRSAGSVQGTGPVSCFRPGGGLFRTRPLAECGDRQRARRFEMCADVAEAPVVDVPGGPAVRGEHGARLVVRVELEGKGLVDAHGE